MCTLTYLPTSEGFILTSSRDEQRTRAAAQAIQWHTHAQRRLLFARDAEQGGTWAVMDENGTVAVLLNGGFAAHRRVLPYRRSRGLILLDWFAEEQHMPAWQRLDVSGIEPFTIVLASGEMLHRLVWDGQHKHTLELNASEQHLFASATLYSEAEQHVKEQLLRRVAPQDADEAFAFHFIKSAHDVQVSMILDRAYAATRSVSQFHVDVHFAHVRHHDLQSDERTHLHFALQPHAAHQS